MNNNSKDNALRPSQPLVQSDSKTTVATSSSGGATATPVGAGVDGFRSPSHITFQHLYKLAVTEDKPVMFDYWTNSLDKTALIGVKTDTNEKLLVKSEEEYTSPISKIFKVGSEYIVVTENSIYVVDVNIVTKRISV